jgi:hypothetical protein
VAQLRFNDERNSSRILNNIWKSHFLDLLGPIYNKRKELELLIGLGAEKKYCNARNLLMLVFLAAF